MNAYKVCASDLIKKNDILEMNGDIDLQCRILTDEVQLLLEVENL